MIAILLCGLAACNQAPEIVAEPTSLYEAAQVEEKYYPQFIEVESAQAAIKPLLFSSVGWSLWSRPHYLFAVYGQYIFRYNIEENRVDKAVNLNESYEGWPFGTSFSSNGRYCIEYSFHFDGDGSFHYFLLDFEEETSRLISASYDPAKAESLPDQIKNEVENLKFKEEETDAGQMESSDFGQYQRIDQDRIGGIIPIDQQSEGELGYYKFVVIDKAQDKILQEYCLNTK